MIPVPVTYGSKPTGVERPPPKKGPKPYLERMKEAQELVEETAPKPGSLRSSLPFYAHLLMVLGAFAPIAYAPSPFRASFFGDLVRAIYPLGYGLTLSAQWVEAGWAGGVFITIACVVGLLFGVLDQRPLTQRWGLRLRLFFFVALSVIATGLGYILRDFFFSSPASSLGAAWIFLTAGAGLYGARESARKSSFSGAAGGAVALFCGGRFMMAGAALLLLAVSGKEFPPTPVARYPWSRSQVALEPLPAPSAVEYDDDLPPATPRAPAWAHTLPFFTSLLLLIGAAAPLAAHPTLVPLFGEFIRGLQPAAAFLTVSSAVLANFPLGTSYIAVTSLFSLAGARFAAGRTRRGAVLAGGVMLLVGLRPLLGLAALFLLFLSWHAYGVPADRHAEPEKSAPEAAGQ